MKPAGQPLFSFVRFLLYPFALLYGFILWLRNRLYDSGFYSSVGFDLPVIAVGNLSTGGTGKTPHIEYLIRLLQYPYRVATMSRGYRRRTQGFLLAGPGTNAWKIGDEPMQFFMKFPDIAVSVAEERMTGIPYLLQRRPDLEVILLDDAYQHRSVKPGLNILITDYARPFYEDYILPLGRLRESRDAYHRADIVIVSKCPPALSEAAAQRITASIAPLPHQQVYFSGLRYGTPYAWADQSPVSLQGKHVLLVCCIANPASLAAYIGQQAAGMHALTYPDHHYFQEKDLEEIRITLGNWQVSERVIVTTEKDAARLQLWEEKLREWNLPIAILPISVYFLFDRQDAFDGQVVRYTEKALSERFSVFGDATDRALPPAEADPEPGDQYDSE